MPGRLFHILNILVLKHVTVWYVKNRTFALKMSWILIERLQRKSHRDYQLERGTEFINQYIININYYLHHKRNIVNKHVN